MNQNKVNELISYITETAGIIPVQKELYVKFDCSDLLQRLRVIYSILTVRGVIDKSIVGRLTPCNHTKILSIFTIIQDFLPGFNNNRLFEIKNTLYQLSDILKGISFDDEKLQATTILIQGACHDNIKTINVLSNNQQAGITANTVNYNLSSTTDQPKKSWTEKIFVLAAIVAILTYLNIFPFKKEAAGKKIISNNQQGGIVANTVNLKPTIKSYKRKLDNFQKMKFHEISLKYKKIIIDYFMNDTEAYQFAKEIKDFLISKGIKVNKLNFFVPKKPFFGLRLEESNDESTLFVKIGTSK
jgi:hypothetical protein